MRLVIAVVLGLGLGLPSVAAAQMVFEGEVPEDDSRFFTIPFTVPEGTVEIEVAHDDLSEANILDWGLIDPDGLRGWGGGNTENAVVGVEAASRSYLPGPIPAGEWQVLVGKAKIAEPPGSYRVEVTLRTEPTLAPMPERQPYEPVPALETGARWYAGDFHVHDRESGDAEPTIDEVATFARGRGLDFVLLSDHNTVSQLELMGSAQARHPELLLIPGVEYTTYAGHANGIGATEYVDFRLGAPGGPIEEAIQAFHDQGALFSINHPAIDIGDLCIGCAWEHDVSPELVDAVEIGTGGWEESGYIFTPLAIEFWEELLATGAHVAPVGGSDDHRAGEGEGGFYSPIGNPTTMVWAEELSVAAIVEGVRQGRTVVKLQSPEDPMVELTAGDAMVGDTVTDRRVTLTVRVTGGMGDRLRLVHDGAPQELVPVDADPFVFEREVQAPTDGVEDRWRAELFDGGHVGVVTGHVWIAPADPLPDAGTTGADGDDGGCGCRVPASGSDDLPAGLLLALTALAGVVLRRRR